MQTKTILVALVSTIPFVCALQPTPVSTFSQEQSSQVARDLMAYQTSLAEDRAFSSVASVLATALPPMVLEEIRDDPDAFLSDMATATALPAYITGLPSDVRDYLSSVAAAEASIISKDLSAAAAPVAAAAAPTTGRAAKLMGVMAAIGLTFL